MILCEMDFSPDFPDPDECLKYHVKDKTPMLRIVKKNKVFNVLYVSNKAYNVQMAGIFKDGEKRCPKDWE